MPKPMPKLPKKELEQAEANLEKYKSFWADINAINFAKGDAKKGAEVFTNAGCAGCHGLSAAGMPDPLDVNASH